MLFFLSVSSFTRILPVLRKPFAVSVDLFHVMHNTEQVPLAVDLVSTTQGKLIQAHHPTDMSKRRFRYSKTHGIHGTADRGIDLALHLLDTGILGLFRAAMKIGDLPDLCSFRMTQALGAERAGQAG